MKLNKIIENDGKKKNKAKEKWKKWKENRRKPKNECGKKRENKGKKMLIDNNKSKGKI